MITDNVVPFERRAPPGPPADFDAAAALRTCRALMQTLGQYDLSEAIYEACVAMLLVNLNDLLQTARSIGKPVDFADHIDTREEVRDVAELVAKCRNAACHAWTRTSRHTVSRFHRIAGYCPHAMQLDDKTLGCDYHDDVAVYYGRHRIYLKRHAARAIEELTLVFGQPAAPA
jgi:hypothetical protein